MNQKLKIWLCVALACLCLGRNGFTQATLNGMRGTLGLTRTAPLENAPPLLAFTTVALGSFRGLISNFLWIRSARLQNEGRYFEMLSLSGWITRLQPNFGAVWSHQSWNMAYNISRQFQAPPDRWRWVRNSVELLRDEGLKYNSNDAQVYRELSYIFQDKIGGSSDDAHSYYKEAWAAEMERLLGERPDLAAIAKGSSPDAVRIAGVLRDKYKMSPERILKVDQEYGPLDWRLPEAHAIYWASEGLEKVKAGNSINLRRVIWQSMQLAFRRGLLVRNAVENSFTLSPNLSLVAIVHQTYLDMEKADPERTYAINRARGNFLQDAVFILYTNGRNQEAAKWFAQMNQDFPKLAGGMNLDDFAINRLTFGIEKLNDTRTKAIIEGLLLSSFRDLALGEDERAVALNALAQKVWTRYQTKFEKQLNRVGLQPFEQMRRDALQRALQQFPPEVANQLRTVLGLPASAGK